MKSRGEQIAAQQAQPDATSADVISPKPIAVAPSTGADSMRVVQSTGFAASLFAGRLGLGHRSGCNAGPAATSMTPAEDPSKPSVFDARFPFAREHAVGEHSR